MGLRKPEKIENPLPSGCVVGTIKYDKSKTLSQGGNTTIDGSECHSSIPLEYGKTYVCLNRHFAFYLASATSTNLVHTAYTGKGISNIIADTEYTFISAII